MAVLCHSTRTIDLERHDGGMEENAKGAYSGLCGACQGRFGGVGRLFAEEVDYCNGCGHPMKAPDPPPVSKPSPPPRYVGSTPIGDLCADCQRIYGIEEPQFRTRMGWCRSCGMSLGPDGRAQSIHGTADDVIRVYRELQNDTPANGVHSEDINGTVVQIGTVHGDVSLAGHDDVGDVGSGPEGPTGTETTPAPPPG
ncbi:hypothetical protein J4H86_23260 [Spiractinospora alimapuensis]|uniref:hypothetical protein n=1 Tax=Spiractinospora alimapuensis TaxID=2820884 RepID=UPI001F289D3A|nr:hypothetical protein [Spiractinospora alimapuensis]QVQ51660.1 hypothetical protein J4H86_23260 [Spiractinospora alimapuensis]